MFKIFGSSKTKQAVQQESSVTARPHPAVRTEQPAVKTLPAAAFKPATPAQQQRPQPMHDASNMAVARKPDLSKGEVSKNRELNDEEKYRLVQMDWSLLTSPGGLAEISASQAQYCAIVQLPAPAPDKKPSNMFVVAKDYVMHPDTSTVRNVVRRKGITVNREVLVDMGTVRAIYEKAALANPQSGFPSSNGATAAVMQSDFIRLLEIAAKSGTSDIHITVDKHTAVIKIRTDGVMMKLKEMPSGSALELLNAIFNMAETSEPTYKPYNYQAARITESSLKGLKFPPGVQSVRLQFNPLPAGGRYLVARLLYAQKVGSTADIDELGYTATQITEIRKMRRKTIGINIVCGPTGSGKSTTLQRSLTAMMRERPGINGITIEDPPEYIIEGWVQLPIATAVTAEERTKNFGEAMNAVLRDDPDAIMIGEIRDLISANLAYGAAETGHTVWASLHANSAIGILDRLRDLGLDLYKLGDATKFTGLVSQRLVRKIHPDHKCGWEEARQNKLVSDELFDTLEKLAGDRIKDIRFAATHRSKNNPNDFFKGRTVAAETILPDQQFLDLYISASKSEALRYWKDKLEGMEMLEHGFALVLMGHVDVRSIEDVVGLIEDIDPARVPKILELVGL